MNNVLIVEDDPTLREAMVDTVELAGYAAKSADNGQSALALLHEYEPNIVVSDVRMDKMDGHQLLKSLQNKLPGVPVILITAHATITDAVSAMRQGAVDYVTKPFEPECLIKKIRQYLEVQVVNHNNPIAEDPKSKQLLALAKKVAQTDATVMIGGESGTGKEVLARYVHDHSPRNDKPFVAINCAAIPENMLEATLFGYEKGAFTGAIKSMPGKFEQAQGGTLLLDEISEMDLALQAKLLRVLQEKEVERLGGNKMISLDVRVLATSNRDMMAEVKANRFREDLFYRLNVFPLQWFPLRERKKDILPLANYLIKLHHSDSQQPLPTLSEAAQQALLAYPWPGNAREMDNVIQRALILQCDGEISAQDCHLPGIQPEHIPAEEQALTENVKQHEFETVLSVLTAHDGNRKKVANELGISERTLRYKLAKMRDAGYDV